MRTGIGYDFHKLVERRKLVLGGVEVPYYRGLIGNSDADVLLHAICDAILGAISEGDIGKHFPPDDPQWADISSAVLLEKVVALAKQKGYAVSNIDSTIVAEKPKLAEFLPRMVENIARVIGIAQNQVSVKATSTDGMGTIGEGKGMAAHAVVTVSGTGAAQSSPSPGPSSEPKKNFFEIS